MIILGLILWVTGLLTGIPTLQTIGLVIGIIGLILLTISLTAGDRRHYW